MYIFSTKKFIKSSVNGVSHYIAADKPLLNCSLTAKDSSSKCVRTVYALYVA